MIAILIGGTFGAASRFYVSQKTASLIGNTYFGSWFVNLVGSFLLGILFVLYSDNILTQSFYNLAGVGFLGAFTTFSTFIIDSIRIMEDKGKFKGIAFILIHVFLSLVLCYIGIGLAKWLI